LERPPAACHPTPAPSSAFLPSVEGYVRKDGVVKSLGEAREG
jgi:hypothetical protein